jgi:outer membrane biogenesis lipoprotein LolB
MHFMKHIFATTATVFITACLLQAGSRHATLDRAQVVSLATSVVLERPIDLADYDAPKVTYDAGTDTWTVFYSSGLVGHSFSITVYDKTREARFNRIKW